MSEYTPTTEQIQDNYVEGMNVFYGERGASEYANQFRRWLDAHDAEVRAAERERAALHADEGYRMEERCDDIAKRIRSGEPSEIAARGSQ